MRKILRKLGRRVRSTQQTQVQPAENKKVLLNLEEFAVLDKEAQREMVANFLRALSRNPEVRKQATQPRNDGKEQ
jgi:hypothetical protein